MCQCVLPCGIDMHRMQARGTVLRIQQAVCDIGEIISFLPLAGSIGPGIIDAARGHPFSVGALSAMIYLLPVHGISTSRRLR